MFISTDYLNYLSADIIISAKTTKVITLETGTV